MVLTAYAYTFMFLFTILMACNATHTPAQAHILANSAESVHVMCCPLLLQTHCTQLNHPYANSYIIFFGNLCSVQISCLHGIKLLNLCHPAHASHELRQKRWLSSQKNFYYFFSTFFPLAFYYVLSLAACRMSNQWRQQEQSRDKQMRFLFLSTSTTTSSSLVQFI